MGKSEGQGTIQSDLPEYLLSVLCKKCACVLGYSEAKKNVIK